VVRTFLSGMLPPEDDTVPSSDATTQASSRLLRPEVIHRLGLAGPLVMMPCPEFILVADARNPKAHASLTTWARDLSSDLFHLDDQGMRLAATTDTRLLKLRAEMATRGAACGNCVWQLTTPQKAKNPCKSTNCKGFCLLAERVSARI
jgi:hypothetical protein